MGRSSHPDGRWIGYIALGKLYKVAVSGGTPVLLTDSPPRILPSGAWLTDDRIVFATSARLLSMPAAGGRIAALEPVGSRVAGAARPSPLRLPRKDAILVTECSNNCVQMTLEALHLGTLKRDTILTNVARSWYLPSGYLVAVPAGWDVVGGRFDADALRFLAPPVPLLAGVRLELGIIPELSIADDGTLVYLPATQTGSLGTIVAGGPPGKGRPSWTPTGT